MNYKNNFRLPANIRLKSQENKQDRLLQSEHYEQITYIKKIYNYYNKKYDICTYTEQSDIGLTKLIMRKKNKILIIRLDEIDIIENKRDINNVIKTFRYKLKSTSIKHILINYNKHESVLSQIINKPYKYIEKNKVVNHIIKFTKYISKISFCLYEKLLNNSIRIYCNNGSIIQYNIYDINRFMNNIKVNNIISLLSQLTQINVDIYYDPTFNTDICEYDITDFTCPISYDIIINPIMTSNHFYDMNSLKKIFLKGYDYDPLTRQPLVIQSVPENYLKCLAKYHREHLNK